MAIRIPGKRDAERTRDPGRVANDLPDTWMDDDGADPRAFGVVPDVVGLTTWEALHTAHGHGFDVMGPDPDGVPITAVTAGMAARVTGQRPAAGTVARRSTTVVEIWTDGGGTTGVREPRRPPPRSSAGAGEGDPVS